MKFGEALEQLERGKKVAREGWNGKGMWLCMFSSLSLGIDCPNTYSTDFILNDDEIGEDRLKDWFHFDGESLNEKYPIKDCICMFTANKEIQVGWLASQADMFARDWVLLD